MKIESFPYGQVRIAAEPTADSPFRIEADVNISGGKAADINNGRVTRIDGEGATEVAAFSDYPSASHRTWFGQPTLDEQVALMAAIDAFCAEARGTGYVVALAPPSDE